MTRLQLPRGCKPSKATSGAKDFRPVLQRAQIVVGDEPEMRVTNSYIAAWIPLGRGDDTGEDIAFTGLVSPAALTAWERKGVADVKDDTVTVDGASYMADDGDFPNLDNIRPEPYRQTFTVGLNAAQLYALSQALGCSELRLTFNAKNPARPVIVETLNGNGASGMAMPMRVDDQGLNTASTEGDE